MDDSDFMFEEESYDVSDRELNRLRDFHSKAGYRDGMSDGQESMLQKGFNDGFSVAAGEYRQSSKLRGCVSALKIFFNNKTSGYERLLQDLESFLNELKEIEAKEPEIDDTMAAAIVRPNGDNLMKNMNLEAVNTEDIEMLVDKFSLGENDVGTPLDNSAQQSDIRSPAFGTESHDIGNKKGTLSNHQYQINNGHEVPSSERTDGKRVRLKYSFKIEGELGKLEELLKSHGIPDVFFQRLRTSIL